METMTLSCTSCMFWTMLPSRGFQTMTLRSSEAVTTSLPPRPQAPHVTVLPWPAKICINLPVGAHHIHAMVSPEPARMAWPLGCQRIHSTSLEGPSRSATRSPVSGFQILTVPSSELLAAYLPSWLKATWLTLSVCPFNRHRSVQESPPPFGSSWIVQRTAASSWPPVINIRLSAGQKATPSTLSLCVTFATLSSTALGSSSPSLSSISSSTSAMSPSPSDSGGSSLSNSTSAVSPFSSAASISSASAFSGPSSGCSGLLMSSTSMIRSVLSEIERLWLLRCGSCVNV
mmetsp:Transcript_871/g.1963  ORF Transcript_871/g.1963 Transcript_871/m.1963 type:complete len:288 (-) Transcript_871:35-898(-)